MMLLSDLNDDCLEQILNFLPLRDQVTLKTSCRCFEDNIKSIWLRRSKKVTITSEELWMLEGALLLEYMRVVSNVVEHLQVEKMGVKQFRILKGMKFAKVKTLECELWCSDTGTNDRDILLMAQLFPSLEKLTIKSNITGRYLWLLENLKHLDVSLCDHLKVKYLAQTFTKLRLRSFSWLTFVLNRTLSERITDILQCDTLEELKVDEDVLVPIMDLLLRMPAMRRIISYCRLNNRFFELAADIIGERMEAIVFNATHSAWNQNLNSLKRMPNLRKLTLHNDLALDAHLKELTVLQNLRELTFTRMINGGVTGLLCLVENSAQLELLDVSRTADVDVQFLKRLIGIVEKQSRKRLMPLELRCYGTELAKMFSETFPLPKYLKVSVAEHLTELPDIECFLCEWQPMKPS